MSKFLLTLYYLAGIVLLGGGWLINLYKFIVNISTFDLLELARMIGIVVFPLGVLLGWVA